MASGQRLSGGELNAAISRIVTKVHTESLGRGPRKAVSFHTANLVVTLLEETLTSAEQTLAANGDGDAVLALRHLVQRSMADELKAQIGRLTGREVMAFMSSNHIEPDFAVEVFVLDGEVDGPRSTNQGRLD